MHHISHAEEWNSKRISKPQLGGKMETNGICCQRSSKEDTILEQQSNGKEVAQDQVRLLYLHGH